MSAPRKTDRRMAAVEGVILPDAVYDTDAVLRCAGIGRVKLSELRRAGRLKPGRVDHQGRTWYRGRELIEVIFDGKGN